MENKLERVYMVTIVDGLDAQVLNFGTDLSIALEVQERLSYFFSKQGLELEAIFDAKTIDKAGE